MDSIDVETSDFDGTHNDMTNIRLTDITNVIDMRNDDATQSHTIDSSKVLESCHVEESDMFEELTEMDEMMIDSPAETHFPFQNEDILESAGEVIHFKGYLSFITALE